MKEQTDTLIDGHSNAYFGHGLDRHGQIENQTLKPNRHLIEKMAYYCFGKKCNMPIITANCCFFKAPKFPLTGPKLPLTGPKFAINIL